MLVQNCAIESIIPYQPSTDKPWNSQRVAHLYRRLGFGASLEKIQAGLNMTPSALVDQLIDGVLDQPAHTPPVFADYTMNDYIDNPDLAYEHKVGLQQQWIQEMVEEGIRAKLAFFWHNHFVTRLDVYDCPAYLWKYFNLLHVHALGNFRTFIEEIGKTPAMLVYLNGNQNIVNEPNENYARELMELFTMGENNGYTQDDIAEVARALTGWRADNYLCTPAVFQPSLWDNGVKTIFGQVGNWNYDEVHELIFTHRKDEVAYHICAKIYKHFVYDEVNETIVNEMAATFKANDNWELAPVFRQLFKSEHFFDETLIGAQIKSPIEAFIYPLISSDIHFPDDISVDILNFISYRSYQVGQEVFNPVNVAGWPGHRDWINENTMANRWNYSSQIFFFFFDEPAMAKLVALALELTNNSNNPDIIVTFVARHFLARELEPEHLAVAAQHLKEGVPQNYFDDGSWTLYWDEAPQQMRNLMNYLVRLPEYQMT